MGYRRGYFRKDGTYVQGHYTSTTAKRKAKSKKGCLSILIFVAMLSFTISCSNDDAGCKEMNCKDFRTQAEAQQAFNSNPNCYKNLDADNDNIACENLSN